MLLDGKPPSVAVLRVHAGMYKAFDSVLSLRLDYLDALGSHTRNGCCQWVSLVDDRRSFVATVAYTVSRAGAVASILGPVIRN